MAQQFLTPDQAAQRLGISAIRVRQLCQQGRIPGATKFAGRWMIPISAQKPPDEKRGRPMTDYLMEEGPPQAVALTQHGKPVLAVMPWELFESILETLEIMGDPKMMAALRQGIKHVQEGRLIPLEEVKASLGID